MATGKSTIKHYSKDNGYEIIPRELLQHCDKKIHGEDGLSLQAIGLLVNLQSYPEDWEINKTELYNRYSKNGRRQVESAWDLLVEKRYIVQFKKRNGKRYDYIYYFSTTPFHDETIKSLEIEEEAKAQVNFKIKEQSEQSEEDILGCTECTAQNEHSNLYSTNRTDNILHTKNITQKHNTQRTYEHSEKSEEHHSSHSTHTEINYEKSYYLDAMPKQVQLTLKNYELNEINSIKKNIYSAISYVNKEIGASFDVHDFEFEIDKVINKIRIKQRNDYQKYGKKESIEELSPLFFVSFRNAFVQLVQDQDASFTETMEKKPKKELEKKNDKQHSTIYASDDPELKEMIDSFRKSRI